MIALFYVAFFYLKICFKEPHEIVRGAFFNAPKIQKIKEIKNEAIKLQV
jgi:hypothetical protein